MFVAFIFFALLQAFVLFCCLAAGNDQASQILSDQEQIEFIKEWNERHAK